MHQKGSFLILGTLNAIRIREQTHKILFCRLLNLTVNFPPLCQVHPPLPQIQEQDRELTLGAPL